MIKLTTAVVLAATFAVPVAYAGDKSNDKTSNVDHKMETKGGKASPGTVGAMNNNPAGSSFTASRADQKKNLTTNQ